MNALAAQLEPISDAEQKAHESDEQLIQEYLFEFRQVMAALLRIKDRRSYRNLYSTFEGYVRAVWPDIFGDISRSYLHRQIEHERTLQAIEEENNSRQTDRNVANGQQIPMPESVRQTRPLHGLPVQDRVAGWELTVEANGGEVPTGAQVSEVVFPPRLDLSDPDPPKWIDARPSGPPEVTPGTYDKSSKKPEPRYTTEIACDGRRMTFNLIVPMRNRDPQKWYGSISRRQWESVGMVFQGLPQTEFEDENDLRSTEDIPDGVSPDVRAAVAKERARIAAIPPPADNAPTFGGRKPTPQPRPAPDLFIEPDRQPDPEDDAPVPSFTAGMDLAQYDQLAEGGFGEYSQ